MLVGEGGDLNIDRMIAGAGMCEPDVYQVSGLELTLMPAQFSGCCPLLQRLSGPRRHEGDLGLSLQQGGGSALGYRATAHHQNLSPSE